MTRHDLSHLFEPGEGGEPPTEFAARREAAPLDPAVLPNGTEVRVAVRHADVREILGSADFVRTGAPVVTDGPDLAADPDQLMNLDPPRHTRVRRLLSGAFTPRAIEDWRPQVADVADALLDDLLARGPSVDLIPSFALPLPVHVLAALLGVPPGDRDRFTGWSDAYLSTAAHTPPARQAADHSLTGYLHALLTTHGAPTTGGPAPAAGRAGTLGTVLGRGLRVDELVLVVRTLIVAGYEPTANVLARGVLRLLGTGQYARLVREPGLVGDAVEEILRYETPGDGGLPRIAARDVELPSGVVLAGEAVMPSMSAANRDPAVFEDPERFDVGRGECPHLSFGYGAHYCLGAGLARLVLGVGLAGLVARLPGLRLAVPADEVPWRKGMLLRGPEYLPVAW